MRAPIAWLLPVLLTLLATSLGGSCRPPAPLGAGFRWSSYGPPPGEDPGPAYWADVASQMAARLPGSVPQGVWIACVVDAVTGGCWLDAGGTGDAVDPLILFTGNPSDTIEAALAEFDAAGVEIWLQVEPGFASVDELIHLLLDRYGHHRSVVGIGVDVEWYRNASAAAAGEPVDDALAASWRDAVRAHGKRFRLFLKHWLPDHLPPTERRYIVFVDDGQGYADLDDLLTQAALWGQVFDGARVGFQIGYDADRPWWSGLADPPGDIGRALAAAVPNMRSLFWVDFTALEVFPSGGS